MAEAYVENGLEFLGHLAGKHHDSWYDKVVGKPRSLPPKKDKSKKSDADNYDGPFREKKPRRNSDSYATYERNDVRSSSVEDVYILETPGTSRASSQWRKQLSLLPPPEPDIGRGNPLTEKSLRRQEQLLPVQKDLLLEKGLPPESEVLQLVYTSKSKSRRDSAMASGYNDNYRESNYRGENDRPRSQPPRGRYYDDDESDYDERTGDRQRGGGRGYDDRDDRDNYDTIRETREVYRGPAANRPWGPERNESGRSDYSDRTYPAGAVAQYRRSEGTLAPSQYTDRTREKSRGRDYSRSRSRSWSRSRSRSRSSSRGGVKGVLQNTFSTTKTGLGAGVVGAVVGGLAGREIGKQQRNRDMIIGAVVGGLAANAGENKWREYKGSKDRESDRDQDRIEMRYNDRSRSNVR